MSDETLGQRWIRFLRGYTPTTQNDNMVTEKIANLVSRYKIDQIRFEHPLEASLFPLFFMENGNRKPITSLKNIILTGMAGDGKSFLCYALWNKLFNSEPPKEKLSERSVNWEGSPLKIKFIFDFSAFFTPRDNKSVPDEVLQLLEEFAESVFNPKAPETIFIIAINDGQFAELWKRLPTSSTACLLADLITEMHATSRQDCEHRLSFFNLSLIPTSDLFRKVYEALISRSEWDECLSHPEVKEFGLYSPLVRNFHALRSRQYMSRLQDLISLSDGCKRHIPIRELLMWLSNGLLGLRNAPQGVARLQELRSCVSEEDAYNGALHRNLLGDNLTPNQRERFAIFRFLQSLKIGKETISDLDELIIFGEHVDAFRDAYQSLVKPDPFRQRDPSLEHKLKSYIQGNEDDHKEILDALSTERRRIFFSSDEDTLGRTLADQSIWATTVFHNAADYLKYLSWGGSQTVPKELLQRMILGLNRVWTGLLAEDNDKLFVAKGLNLSSAPVSDIFVMSVSIKDDFGYPLITANKGSTTNLLPQLRIEWRHGHDPFVFDLTLERFEFLIRVSDGVMPNAFSKECWEDIITLKTKFLRHMERSGGKAMGIRSIETDKAGRLQLISIA